jgi:hypothetical protein
MEQNGKTFYEQELSFSIGADKYEKIFAKVAGKDK